MNHFFFVHQNPLPYSGQVATPTDLSCFSLSRKCIPSFYQALTLTLPLPCLRKKKKKTNQLVLHRRVKIHLQKRPQLFKTFPVSLSKPPSRWESRGNLFVCFGLARNSQSVACYCLACTSPHGQLPWAMLWSWQLDPSR